MKLSFEGIGERSATFYAGSTAKAGAPVKVTDNGKIDGCAKDDEFAGIAMFVNSDGYASVMMRGYAAVKYSGTTAPALGWQHLVADGNGGVTAAASAAGGRMYLVVTLDTTSKTVGFFM